MKLNVKHFFILKSTDTFQLQLISKIKFLQLIKPILTTKVKTSNKIKKIQHNEIIIHEHNKEQANNVDDIDIDNTLYLHHSIAHYYQRKEVFNYVLTNENKL